MERWQYKALLIILFITIIIGYPFFAIKYFETQTAIIIVWRYFLLPIFIVSALASPFFYFKKVKPLDKEVISKRKEKARDIVTITLIVITTTFISFGITFSLIITTNKWFGNSETLIIKETVLNYQSNFTKNGRLRHYIKFLNPISNDTIRNFEVFRSYEKGEIFEKEMSYGAWGILYAVE